MWHITQHPDEHSSHESWIWAGSPRLNPVFFTFTKDVLHSLCVGRLLHHLAVDSSELEGVPIRIFSLYQQGFSSTMMTYGRPTAFRDDSITAVQLGNK